MTIEYSCNVCLKPHVHYITMDMVINGEAMKLTGYYCTEHLIDRLKHIIKYMNKPPTLSLNPMENKK